MTGNNCKKRFIYRRIHADPKNYPDGRSIVSSRFVMVLICGIPAIVAAFMHCRESGTIAGPTLLMFITPIPIFIVAGMLYKEGKTGIFPALN